MTIDYCGDIDNEDYLDGANDIDGQELFYDYKGDSLHRADGNGDFLFLPNENF
jgi:hypothetical protein